MISVIINSWKEPHLVPKAIDCIANSKYSGIPNDFELIQISPDDETLFAGQKQANILKLGNKYIQIKDPLKGKPFALNMALERAKGDIVILTDGDVYFDKLAVKFLLLHFVDAKVGGVTGRPVPQEGRDNFWGYTAHLLTDAANDKRIRSKTFFPMSGYIIAARKVFDLPADALSDDAYISYDLANKGYKIVYESKARVFVKFPKNFKDYIMQKTRSLGGYIQLKRMGVMEKYRQSRSFLSELKYAFFVLRYPKNIMEFVWSLMLFPVRLITWIVIFYKQYVLKQNMPKKGWKRIETTK